MCLSLPAGIAAFAVATGLEDGLEGFEDTEAWVPRLSVLERLHLLILPGLAAILVLTLAAAFLSREPLRARLGLVRPRGGWLRVPLYALSAPVAGAAGAFLAGCFFKESSAHVEAMTALITEPRGMAAVYVMLWLSAAPGAVEELFYRGFVQQRLQRCWPAPLAVVVTGTAFAVAHLDPMHIVSVLPVGLWLSFVAWGTRSVVPSMVCHAVFNAGMMLAARAAPEDESAMPTWLLVPLAAGFLAFAASVPLLLRAGLRRP
jgi:membrane protease YdiL (CAAX protease family)